MDVVYISPGSGRNLLIINMSDGSKWGVNVHEIAANRAKHYADEFDGCVEKSLAEDTLPLFRDCPGEIIEWASNQMDWDDFKTHYLIEEPPAPDFQKEWVSGCKEVVEY